MTTPPDHRCHVFGSPWPGIFGTCIESGRHYGRHWHATYGFGLLEQGAQRSASGRGQVDAQAGDLITTNPGEVHDGRPLGGPSRRWRMVYLDPAAFDSMSAGRTTVGAGTVELTRPVIRDLPLARAVRQLLDRLEAWSAAPAARGADALACEESLVRAGGLLLERHTTGAPAREAGADVRLARDALAADLLDPPTLAELALRAGLSRYQLLRRFEKVYGVPPHTWLLQQRCEQARGLIRRGVHLAEAAACCGFADQSHMTRSFVRQFGFTPGAWQRATAPRRLQ